MIVDYYFIISDFVLDQFDGQKIWHTQTSPDLDDPVDYNSIPYKISRKYLLYSDKVIACKDRELPIYLKNRETSYRDPVTEDMVYIKLASRSING